MFFGGGGGAGHSNGAVTVSKGGGHGGGVILIQADNLIGNGYKISANGGKGGNAASDGASGGGAGGSIILDANTYSGSVTIQAIGGKGGDENDLGTTQRCYGAGGGVVVVRSILPGRYLLFLFYLPVALQVLNSEVTRLVMPKFCRQMVQVAMQFPRTSSGRQLILLHIASPSMH